MSQAGRVVLIERQDFWRERCTSALRDRGYAVHSLATYDVAGRLPPPEAADLVIVGCTSVGPAEVRLVGELRRSGEPVLLVCTLPETRSVHAGFSAGATDVVARPYETAAIIDTVDRALTALARRTRTAPAAERGA